jgi:hypothetical protein
MTTKVQIDEEREHLEALIWECTEWRGSRETVDKILAAVDRFATAKAEFLRQYDTPRGQNSHKPKPTQEQIELAIQAIERRAHEPAVLAIEAEAEDETAKKIVEAPAGGKECKACKTWKSFDDFTKDKTRSDGYLSRCKRCVKEKRLISST